MAFLFAGSAYAVVDPQSVRDSAPVALKCNILGVTTQDQGAKTSVIIKCDVLDVIRTYTEVRRGEAIEIRYSVSKEVADIPRTPGPAPASNPPILRNGQVVVAYLKRARSPDGSVYYMPGIGFESFDVMQPKTRRASVRPTPERRCLETGPGSPTMGNAKFCAQERFNLSEQELEKTYAELHKVISSELSIARETGDTAMEAEMSGKLQSLDESQKHWTRYRKETCRYAYYQYFGGSMARLEELVCLLGLTERRIEQLTAISSLSGEGAIEY